MSDKVLIAGCGDVGNALATRLLADGCEVWGVRRRVEALAEAVRPWRIDLTEPRGFDAPPAAFDYVFYTASADRRDEDQYRSVYVDGLRDLLGALRTAGCPLQRVFFTSSTAVYGQDDGAWVDEDSATVPPRFNGRVLLEAEAIIRDAPRAQSLEG
jgi:nucleoside-diphosphate-sugar epimerase